MEIKVIGGGLAGSEAAYQIARRGLKVTLYEMRPIRMTPAHKSDSLSELVCSNSLKSREITNAHGLLKEELRGLGSLIVRAANATEIPGGKALVVDRERFSRFVTEAVTSSPNITLAREEITQLPPGPVIIASGPLTSDGLAARIVELTGSSQLYFFDAISPIIDGSSIDMDKAFYGSRYDDTRHDYLNCPMSRTEYELFLRELLAGRRIAQHEFEKTPFFEGCLPVEVMAERGPQTLLYGPMKPVGMTDPATGRRPYAVVQLRREDHEGRMFNIVGFQTKLAYPDQERIFRLIPALKNAQFLRYGSIHRNTYINSPSLLDTSLRLKNGEHIYFAGQITGVEGYIESTAMGFLAGISAASIVSGREYVPPPDTTCLGALLKYITTPRDVFQPMNINFGLFSHYNKKEKQATVDNALSAAASWGERFSWEHQGGRNGFNF